MTFQAPMCASSILTTSPSRRTVTRSLRQYGGRRANVIVFHCQGRKRSMRLRLTRSSRAKDEVHEDPRFSIAQATWRSELSVDDLQDRELGGTAA